MPEDFRNRWTDPDEATAPRLIRMIARVAGVPWSPGVNGYPADVCAFDTLKPGRKAEIIRGKAFKPVGNQLLESSPPAGEVVPAGEAIGKYLTRAQMALHGYSKAEVADAYAAISQDPIRRRKLHLMELVEAISKRSIHPSLLRHGATGDDGRTYDPTEVLEALRKLPPEEMKRISEADVISPEQAALLNGTNRNQVEAIVKAASK